MSNNAALLAQLGLNAEVEENKVVEGQKLGEIPAGTFGGRLVGVVETGEHPGFDDTKTKNEVILVFQLFGKKVPVATDKDGNEIPRLDFLRLNKSFGSKGNFLPVFNTLNGGGSAVNYFQLLGSPCRVKREEYQKKDGSKGIKIPTKGGILGTLVEVLDEDGMGTGEYKTVNVPEATQDFMVYQWETGNQAQFDTLPFWMQKIITEALNYKDSKADGLTMKEDPRKKSEGDEEASEPVEEKPNTATKKANKAQDEEFEF